MFDYRINLLMSSRKINPKHSSPMTQKRRFNPLLPLTPSR